MWSIALRRDKNISCFRLQMTLFANLPSTFLLQRITLEVIARQAALGRPAWVRAWVAANGWLALGRSHWMQGEGLLSENLEPTLLLIYSRWVGGWHGGCLLASWLAGWLAWLPGRPTELPGRPINSSDHPPNHPPTHHLCAIYVSTHAISSAIHVWWIASAACFQRVESVMPLLGVENEGKVNACPNLIAATHWILYTHMCQRLRTIPLPERMTVLPNQSGE